MPAESFIRNASIFDPFWGMAFILVTWLTVAKCPQERFVTKPCLLAILVMICALPLSCSLLWRNCCCGEDSLYRAMCSYHVSRFWWVSLLTVFGLQVVTL